MEFEQILIFINKRLSSDFSMLWPFVSNEIFRCGLFNTKTDFDPVNTCFLSLFPLSVSVVTNKLIKRLRVFL